MITKDDKGVSRELEVVFTNNGDVLGVIYKNNYYPVGAPCNVEITCNAVYDDYGNLIWIIDNGIVYTVSKSAYIGKKESLLQREEEKFRKILRE